MQSSTTGPPDCSASPGAEGRLQIFDTVTEGHLACRVCGALVSREGDYAQVHWDWHEAANGA
jgi:hypothetical protein